MLYTKCPACGVALSKGIGNVSVCPRCLRGFRSNETTSPAAAVQPVTGRTTAQTEADPYSRKIAALLISIVCVGIIGGAAALPVILILTALIVRFAVSSATADTGTETKTVSSGAPKTGADYRKQLNQLPLDTMPLGKYGFDADAQLRLLDNQKKALTEMLGTAHPFQKNAADAEQYVLNNCKQVLYRLRYCDQSDPAFCRIHAEYMQQRLQENARVLRDFEKLIIEVTQMNQDMPVQEPCLDVLADTLRNIRTQETAMPQQRMMQ
ncbi:MAG: hypothetical protein J5722_06610 [Oscillospiraceae bacterium]|nr:hypothetical protein [Oscillospiraceae bacterium]